MLSFKETLAAPIFWQDNYEKILGKLFKQYLQYNIFFYVLFSLISAEIAEILFHFFIFRTISIDQRN